MGTPDSLNSSYPWFAIHVRSNHEAAVVIGLNGLALESYCPTYHLERQGLRHVKQITKPLFAGYVFVRLDPSTRMEVLKLSGVVRLVGFGGEPIAIDDSEIAAIYAIERSGMVRVPWNAPNPGEPVEVLGGPLRGIHGFLTDDNRRSRLVVTLTLLNRAVAVEMDRDWIVSRPSLPFSAANRCRSITFSSPITLNPLPSNLV